jgi:hypothetical protein
VFRHLELSTRRQPEKSRARNTNLPTASAPRCVPALFTRIRILSDEFRPIESCISPATFSSCRCCVRLFNTVDQPSCFHNSPRAGYASMKYTVYDRLLQRELGQHRKKYTDIRGFYGDRQWVEDLDIVNELEGHNGCVNALRYIYFGVCLSKVANTI